MKKIFYLKNCDSCTRLLKSLDLTNWDLREIKTEPLTEEELDAMYAKTKLYKALFNTRSTQIRARNIDLKNLDEYDLRDLLLDHYSFMKRPIFLAEDEIFIGHDSQTVDRLKGLLQKEN